MDLTLTEEQRQLAGSARHFLTREWSGDVVRELEADTHGFRPALWKRLVALGWPAIVFDEAAGGLGGGLADLVVIAEELGRAAAGTPLPTSVALGALPLSLASCTPAAARWLPGLVEGELVAAGALLEPDGRTLWPGVEAQATGQDGWRLSGAKTMVAFAGNADVLLVTACLAGRGHALLAVPAQSPGVLAERLDLLGGEPYYRVRLDGVPVAAADVVADGAEADELVARAVAGARLLDCAWAVGLCEGALALSVEHARTRTQFGKPIGAFQAVAHRLVDVRSEVDALRLLVFKAAWAMDSDHPPDVHLASMAGYAGWTARKAAAETHQVLGAIGFTMEHDLQLFTRRLKAFEARIGPPHTHLENVATAIGLIWPGED